MTTVSPTVTKVELSFNDIPQAMNTLLEKQQKMEKDIQDIHRLLLKQRVENTHYPMTIQQVSEYTGIPVSSLYEMLSKGELPGCKFGKRWQIYRDELDKTLEAHRVNKTPLSAEQQNAIILASNRHKPKNARKYNDIL